MPNGYEQEKSQERIDELSKLRERKGIKFAFAEPDSDKVIVSMLEFRDRLYVATQKGVYILEEDDKFVRLELVDETP